MMEHYFPLKYQSIQTQLRVLAPRNNPGVHLGQFQQSDLTAAPRAHTCTSDVTNSKFQFQSTCYKWLFISMNFHCNRLKQCDLLALFRELSDHPSYNGNNSLNDM